MNQAIIIIVSFILIYLIIYQIKVWKWRCFVSPGFYFGALWLLGVVGSDLFSKVGLLPLAYPKYLNELNIYVGFTGLCFIFLTKKGRSTINEDGLQFNFIPQFSIFSVLVIFTLIVSIITFATSGLTFNMGRNRNLMHETVENQSVLVGYFQVLSTVLSICSGYIWGKYFIKEIHLCRLQKIILIFPILSGLIYSIYLGGRVNLIYAICDLIIGFSLAIPLNPNRKISKKIIVVGLLIGLGVSFFISAVASQRQEYYNSGESENFDLVAGNSVILKVLYGPLEYMTSSYLGYQYRRVDFVDLDHLGYGTYTFNGFINWNLPFAGLLGLSDFNIADMLNIYHAPQESYDYTRDYFYTTHSCYIPIVQDFGKWGAFPFILLLVFIAHNLFVNIQKKKYIRYACSLFFFYLFLQYWLKSNYYGNLMAPITSTLYGFLIIDILNFLIRRK